MISMLNRRQFVSGAAVLGIAAISAASFSGMAQTAAADEGATREIADNMGTVVEIPVEINKVADLWHAHNQIVLMLGAGDKIVATTENFKNMPWANVVYPRLAEIPAVVTGNGAGEIAYEELLKTEPDVCFTSNDEKNADLAGYGMVGMNMGYATFDTLRSNVEITAEVLGGGAPELAAEFLAELDANIAYVAETLGDVSDEDKVRVLHIVRGTGLTTVDGSNTIIDEWIKLAGGINCMADLGIEGNMQEVTMEEILNADPDVIIVGSTAAQEGIETILTSEEWAGIKAVQNGAVYANPMGVFPWDRYSGEEALQILWAAKMLNPDAFADLDLEQRVKDFYAKYYGYELTDDEAARILANEDPEAAEEQAA